MASHQLAIAKASFSAGLLRPDPTSVPRDDIAAFHSALDRALSRCSSANIQTCKEWLLQYVASSANRLAGLAKYLVTLAGSFAEDPTGPLPKPSPKRRRLHILYLLNDLFHHSKYHLDTTAIFSTVSGSLQPHVVDLLGHAAAYDRQKYPRHHRRLDDLLDIWSEHGYFSPDLIHKLREVVKNSALTGAAPPSSTDVLAVEGDTTKKLPGKDTPFVMPLTHGDPSTPYYDLPAGNMIPHIIPNSTIPLRAESIKPLQFMAGPADETLVQALKGFLKDVDQIYGIEELVKDDGNTDVDEMGQRVVRDEITGDIIDGETYYGWSRAFCQQMKKRPDDSRSRSRSRSGTRHDTKRRRYSDSSMSDDSRRSRSRSRSRGDRREPNCYGSKSRSQSPYSPRGPSPPRFPPPHQPSHPLPHPPAQHANHPPQPSHQNHPYNAQYGHYNANFPPPPPPSYPGAWPPAPPPHMPGMPFPPPGPGINHNPPAFPPAFSGYPSHMPVPPEQPLPPGQYHFPPPHSGGQHGGSWGPPGGKNWR
ncbi:hypothetical protein N7509_012605 [Penicillium cosmopolitanum]|uniref:CID domain-containing protein n=1 Tax=Penicillium cosmopolitanum TaxID=1131564 RepID=A0A9W9SJ12_9EURO|nr:uncharacterized protein N7509_012605 [Penicillium cosmopolitanum]KAJ5379486.1 hypothetical protein N7509_012605 [Penicillium cosmopolitanum]